MRQSLTVKGSASSSSTFATSASTSAAAVRAASLSSTKLTSVGSSSPRYSSIFFDTQGRIRSSSAPQLSATSHSTSQAYSSSRLVGMLVISALSSSLLGPGAAEDDEAAAGAARPEAGGGSAAALAALAASAATTASSVGSGEFREISAPVRELRWRRRCRSPIASRCERSTSCRARSSPAVEVGRKEAAAAEATIGAAAARR
mmetsp:Transcript_8583/g.26938  ORF Transcript_8583/g.26938 Transcript_8583/m.26938 type:complete len:203 (-) Transcript_8583:1003-1611(-)